MTPRIVLAGNNLAAILVLDLILELAGKENVLCIAPAGGHHDWQPSLAEHALKEGVVVLEPEDVNHPGIVQQVAAFRPSLFLSVYYTQLFRPALLEAVDCPVLNFHPSLLPRHRGVAPLIWAIMEGDDWTGVTCHHVDAGIDTGPIVMQRDLRIKREDTGYSLHQRTACLVAEMADVLLSVVYDIGAEVTRGIAQTGDVSYHSRDQDLRHLDWTQPRERIRNIVRANCPPLHGAYLMAGDRKIVLGRVEHDDNWGLHKLPGTVVVQSDGGFDDEECDVSVWAADGQLRIVTYLDGTELRSGTGLAATLKNGMVVT